MKVQDQKGATPEESWRVDELRARMKVGTRIDGRPYLHDVWFSSPKLQKEFTYVELMNAPREVKQRVIDEAMREIAGPPEAVKPSERQA